MYTKLHVKVSTKNRTQNRVMADGGGKTEIWETCITMDTTEISMMIS